MDQDIKNNNISNNMVHFLPIRLTMRLAIKGPRLAPTATKELSQAPSSTVTCTFSVFLVIFGIVGELHVNTHPAATAARLAVT